jgi:hypothetical protein
MLNLSRNLGLITGASVMGAVFALASATTDITTARPEAVASGMRITFSVAAAFCSSSRSPSGLEAVLSQNANRSRETRHDASHRSSNASKKPSVRSQCMSARARANDDHQTE